MPRAAVAELAMEGCWPSQFYSKAVNTSRSDPRAIRIATIQPKKEFIKSENILVIPVD